MQKDFCYDSKRKTRIRKDPCHKPKKGCTLYFPACNFLNSEGVMVYLLLKSVL